MTPANQEQPSRRGERQRKKLTWGQACLTRMLQVGLCCRPNL